MRDDAAVLAFGLMGLSRPLVLTPEWSVRDSPVKVVHTVGQYSLDKAGYEIQIEH